VRNRIINEDLDLSGKTILIAGANGFIPAYIVETLFELKDRRIITDSRIIGIARNREKALSRFSDYTSRKDYQLLIHDINLPITIQDDVDFIIHAASQASPAYYGKDPVGTLNANVLGTHNLLSLALKKRTQNFMFFSSSEVYGEVDDKLMPIKENIFGYLDPMNVRSCYAESKRMGETMCTSWSHQYGIPVKIVRPFHTYGPGMRLNDGRVFSDFVADHNIVMKSDGRALRSFCYLSDAISGFFHVLLRGANREAYNIGNNRAEVSILQLANKLANLYPERNLKVISQQERTNINYLKSNVSRACPDITKARALGWQPQYSIEEGFKRTVRSFLE
jgi:UDP-glucuronate decarboxylase